MPAQPSSRSKPKPAAGKTSTPANASTALDFIAKAKSLPTIVLLYGSEEFLATQCRDTIRRLAKATSDQLETVQLDASTYQGGELLLHSSPSLFGGDTLIEVSNASSMSEAFLTDAMAYVRDPAPDVCLSISHSGGMRGKKLIDAMAAAGVTRVECQPLKKDAEKAHFVQARFRMAHKQIEPQAITVLVSAVGADLGELASACAQLMSDVEGNVTVDVVQKYYGDRVEATAFKVADFALSGRAAEALSHLRFALETGVDPVPLVATLALKVRQVARVYGAVGSSASFAKAFAMAPWQVDAAKRESRRFTEEGLKHCLVALAEADVQVKGASRDPIYAVERAVLTIARSARQG